MLPPFTYPCTKPPGAVVAVLIVEPAEEVVIAAPAIREPSPCASTNAVCAKFDCAVPTTTAPAPRPSIVAVAPERLALAYPRIMVPALPVAKVLFISAVAPAVVDSAVPTTMENKPLPVACAVPPVCTVLTPRRAAAPRVFVPGDTGMPEIRKGVDWISFPLVPSNVGTELSTTLDGPTTSPVPKVLESTQPRPPAPSEEGT
jgi:hypothetical protein